LGKTLVVNCNMGGARGGAMIDLDGENEPLVKML
jgi:hypothetical protein